MKRAVFLSIFILLALLISPKSNYSYAQENVVETDTPIGESATATKSAPTVEKVNYELPYPGMLPDNPFYFLKVIRDGIVKMLINDNLKRARFSLESGEKRMYAAKLLVEKNKDELAVETISKSNNYLNDAVKAIGIYINANPKSTDAKQFLHQFDTAVLKHMEIAGEIKDKVDKKYQSSFSNEQKRMKKVEQSVKGLLLNR